jgi:hypothetical protein
MVEWFVVVDTFQHAFIESTYIRSLQSHTHIMHSVYAYQSPLPGRNLTRSTPIATASANYFVLLIVDLVLCTSSLSY